eukprot:4505287-Pyramimonas_sp.AAC.1
MHPSVDKCPLIFTVPEAKGVAASQERRGSAVCVLELRDSPFIGGLPSRRSRLSLIHISEPTRPEPI